MKVIDAIEQAEREATVGEWAVQSTPAGRGSEAWREIVSGGRRPIVRADAYQRGGETYFGVWIKAEDAALIAIARNHLPAMLRALRASIAYRAAVKAQGYDAAVVARAELDAALEPLKAEVIDR